MIRALIVAPLLVLAIGVALAASPPLTFNDTHAPLVGFDSADVIASRCVLIQLVDGAEVYAELGMDGFWSIRWDRIADVAAGPDEVAAGFATLLLAARGRLPETQHLDTNCKDHS